MLVDNILWSGKVVEAGGTKRQRHQSHFSVECDYIANDQRVEQVILSVRDGIMMVRKR